MSLKKILVFRIVFFLLLLVSESLAQAPAKDLNATVQAIDEHYNRLKSLKPHSRRSIRGAALTVMRAACCG